MAVPAQIVDEVTAVLVMRSTSHEEFGDAHVRPMGILASQRGHGDQQHQVPERLQRAHQDLENRKEMIELYDRLLRHDLGNDLQVVSGFSDALVSGPRRRGSRNTPSASTARRSVRPTSSTASATLVSTLEAQDEPEPRDLGPLLTKVVEDNRAQFDDLSVEFDPESSEYRTYGGELLESVFSNLLSNAAVHNDGPMTVRVSVDETGPSDVVVNVEGRRGAASPPTSGTTSSRWVSRGPRARGPDSDWASSVRSPNPTTGASASGTATWAARRSSSGYGARERVSQKRCPSGERGSKAVDGLFSPVIPCKRVDIERRAARSSIREPACR